MNTPDSHDLIKKYVEYATIEGETKLSGDYKKGNRMVVKLNNIFDIIKGDRQLSIYVLSSVMESHSVRARGLAAVDALRLGICIPESVKALEEISLREDIWGFGSKMALRIWRGEFPGKTL
ncbi:MAG: hypothetical protein HGA39_00310 [Coriobacteriia bacterium]|nr:hypothetical protein [Coriobacteriia bacterium]